MSVSAESEEVDPNTLWPSVWESATYSVDPGLQQEAQAEGYNEDVHGAILKMKRNIREFWAAHEPDFRRFWSRMRAESRENFVLDGHPLLVHSFRDRYYIINGAKVYGGRYDRYLILAPWMTVEYLIDGDNLPALIEDWTADNALNRKAGEMAIKFRKMFDAGLYPLTSEEQREYVRERVPQEGDLGVSLLGGTLRKVEEESFGSILLIKEPHSFLSGTCPPAPVGGTVNLYEKGKTIHPK